MAEILSNHALKEYVINNFLEEILLEFPMLTAYIQNDQIASVTFANSPRDGWNIFSEKEEYYLVDSEHGIKTIYERTQSLNEIINLALSRIISDFAYYLAWKDVKYPINNENGAITRLNHDANKLEKYLWTRVKTLKGEK
ncbi:hypothetical protein AB996_2188 [Lactococcus cremoris]|uniref:Uncharacterized protein n=1 Tax=Lactococcus lactis subsp. cremoris TaxID=1359 RepID=A0A166ISW0_LACLC|nr:hypothetical protein [Lactococcus cremoris]KZK04835.1 hypothetical protein AB996_2188 [Lactococcus cremoris]